MNIDIGAILSRAFNIVKNNRALWILGFLAALGGVGGGSGSSFNLPSGGGNFGTPSSGNAPSLPGDNPFDQLGRLSPETWQAVGAIAFAICCVFIIIGIVLWLVGLVANGGIIVGANRAETEGPVALGDLWRASSPRLLSFIGMRILLAIPAIVILIIFGIIIGVAIAGAGGLAALSSEAGSDNIGGAVGMLFSGIACTVIPLVCVLWIYSIISGAIQMLGDRAISIDHVGAMDAIRQGWALFRANLGNVIIMGIILALIGAVIGILAAIVGGIVLIPSILLFVSQASREGGPQAVSFLVFGLSFLVFMVIVAVISSVVVAFRATTWTLVYRQISGKGTVAPSISAPQAPLPVQ